ncbi:hypothetical protein F7731_23815 [Cytobacillus depressus]|uniref:Uncharacterized protein n=1 Tax=Cytobacillus depressus TaxID=1602942 RepID=A0A6L3UYB2_9BACI|nr:hypothetical protein [Cytobacillus depressus]KAB2328980.1 hypothetical protein F7731_23815 [Cytobacillus depressus]
MRTLQEIYYEYELIVSKENKSQRNMLLIELMDELNAYHGLSEIHTDEFVKENKRLVTLYRKIANSR